jgi:hypothetical protein
MRHHVLRATRAAIGWHQRQKTATSTSVQMTMYGSDSSRPQIIFYWPAQTAEDESRRRSVRDRHDDIDGFLNNTWVLEAKADHRRRDWTKPLQWVGVSRTKSRWRTTMAC